MTAEPDEVDDYLRLDCDECGRRLPIDELRVHVIDTHGHPAAI